MPRLHFAPAGLSHTADELTVIFPTGSWVAGEDTVAIFIDHIARDFHCVRMNEGIPVITICRRGESIGIAVGANEERTSQHVLLSVSARCPDVVATGR